MPQPDPAKLAPPTQTPFMFATGVENSAPIIDHGKTRMDELEKCGHYERWQEDFALVPALRIPCLRYGPPLHRVRRSRQVRLPLEHNVKSHCILGNDYSMTNEHRVHPDGTTTASGEVFGYDELTRQYYARYRIPVMHTETNVCEGPNGDEAENWLWKEWANVQLVRNEGVPIVGFTWYSLIDQVDWDSALRENKGRVNPLGLCDLDRKVRRVGLAYRRLIEDWREVLAVHGVCLQVPLSPVLDVLAAALP